MSKAEDYSVGYKTSDIGLKDYYHNTDKKVFIAPRYSRVLRPLCKVRSLILEVDDFSIGYTLNFVSQLCGYDSSARNGTLGVAYNLWNT